MKYIKKGNIGIEDQIKSGSYKTVSDSPTIEDFKDLMETLSKKQDSLIQEKRCLVLSESDYDRLTETFGENCGWDKNYVTVLRGYPKFD